MEEPKPVPLPIDGTLDLHTFHPQDIKELVPEYIEECLARHIYDLRIIHGKGMGILRRTVHSLLEKNSHVEWYQLADETGGGWGATLVRLKQD